MLLFLCRQDLNSTYGELSEKDESKDESGNDGKEEKVGIGGVRVWRRG